MPYSTGTRSPAAADLAQIQTDISNIRASNALLQEVLGNSLLVAASNVSAILQARVLLS